MALDDFDLSPDMAADPLDMTGIVSPPSPQPSGFHPGDMAKLMALIPMAAKGGGMAAVGALLRGMQRGRVLRQQEGQQANQDARLAAQDDRLASQAQSQDDARRAQAQNAEAQRKQQFMGQFNTALGGVDSPEAVRALLDFYGGQAETFGVARPELEKFAMGVATPDALTSRKVSKRWEKMDAKSRELAQQTQASLQIDGQTIPYQTWAPLMGGMVDPKTGAYPTAAEETTAKQETRSLDVQAADALAKGDTATYERLLRVKREMGQADDRQSDPRLAEIQRELAEARLDNMRSAKNSTGLPPNVARRVDAKAKGWDALPIVKTTQKMAEAVSFANSLDINTKNPADDQALIYAFAKAMDPDSVVREGEYATVQKYGQSWAEAFGFNAARIFSNTPFLTPQARANMKRTILSKYAAGRAQYDNVRRSYGSQINRITGQADGEEYLTDYAGGFPDSGATPQAAPDARTSAQDKLRQR